MFPSVCSRTTMTIQALPFFLVHSLLLGLWFNGSTIRRVFLLCRASSKTASWEPRSAHWQVTCERFTVFESHRFSDLPKRLDLLPQVWLELSVHIGVGLTRRRRLTKTHVHHAGQALRFISSLRLCLCHLANFFLDLRPQVRQGEVLSWKSSILAFCKTKQLVLGLISSPLLLLLLPLECPPQFQPGIWRHLVPNHFAILLLGGYMFCHSGVLVLQGCRAPISMGFPEAKTIC